MVYFSEMIEEHYLDYTLTAHYITRSIRGREAEEIGERNVTHTVITHTYYEFSQACREVEIQSSS